MKGFYSYWERLSNWLGDQWDDSKKKGVCLAIPLILLIILLLLYFGPLGNPLPEPESWHVVRTFSWEAPPGEPGEGGGEYGDVFEIEHDTWRLRLIADAEPSCVEQYQPEPCALSFISVTANSAFFQNTPIDVTFDQFSSLNELLTPDEPLGSDFELTVYALEVASWDIQLQAWY